MIIANYFHRDGMKGRGVKEKRRKMIVCYIGRGAKIEAP